MKCNLCDGRGYVLEYAGLMRDADKVRLKEECDRPGLVVLERGLKAVECPACKALDVRVMFWAAALGCTNHGDPCRAREIGDALWKEWKKAHEPE